MTQKTSYDVLSEKLDETLRQLKVAQDAFKGLFNFRLGDLKAHAELSNGLEPSTDQPWGYDPEDEKAPFFSEAFLYNLLGKEDARTVLAYTRRIGEALGLDSEEFYA